MPYLILVEVGPVQGFIASARRSRDLWFGSWFLSELSKAAARHIARLPKGELIFPSPEKDEDLDPNTSFNASNHILALVGSWSEADADGVRDAVIARACKLASEAFDLVKGDLHKTTAMEQVRDLPEIYAVALPLATDERDYAAVRTQLGALMAARKTLRPFAQPGWGKPGVPKSSLDGQRESVIPETMYKTLTQWELYKRYRLRPGEQLCGVGMLKRHGRPGAGASRDATRFMSTSHVAALPLLAYMREKAKTDPAAQDKVDALVKSLTGLGVWPDDLGPVPGREHPVFGAYDGRLLFEERLRELLPDPNDKRVGEEARKALRSMLKATVDGKRPLAYYGLLVADGDNMGRVIDAQKSVEEHRRFSKRLAGFAGQAREIVIEREGWLIYSGGDDVLALVPVHTALECANQLADVFREALAGFEASDGSKATLSVGLAICHHLDPIADALDLAREALATAKRVPGKDALAVTLSKRSGVDRTVSGRWGQLDRRLTSFVDLHRLDAIPDGAAYELRDLWLRLADGQSPPTLNKPIRQEAERILRRKRAKGGKDKVADAVVDDLLCHLDRDGVTVRELAEELVIAANLAQAADLAGLPLPDDTPSPEGGMP